MTKKAFCERSECEKAFTFFVMYLDFSYKMGKKVKYTEGVQKCKILQNNLYPPKTRKKFLEKQKFAARRLFWRKN